MFYLIITLAIGLLVPFQIAANSRLRQVVGPAYVSTLVSFSVSTLALLLVSLLSGSPIVPTGQMLADASWWSWFAGLVAVVTITISIHLFKEIGPLQAHHWLLIAYRGRDACRRAAQTESPAAGCEHSQRVPTTVLAIVCSRVRLFVGQHHGCLCPIVECRGR